ncbi:hypothetical protein M422DRAFT_271733 [Sphaerobolus stellatus SS14]|uniref:FAD-binding PCMH-type domain-containing protein n=1 Tax=Sphaerobolus stellatus (strain SS14) TaxID=990650 RepID=A0A0C9UNQ6_SPHS4|nr:hypothetical protein M422DRAFT_271733 [Sphaerobolus stellatus SS14]
MEKSTGHGALSVWTHHLTKTESLVNYKTAKYNGPAVTAQAGVSVAQIYNEASQHGLATVGYTDGFLQGGGHGPLSSLYRLAADDILSFQVITTQGDFVTASPSESPDLFFALSGGVISFITLYVSFAHAFNLETRHIQIVWTATIKAHPDVPITAATVIFSTSSAVTLDAWFKDVDAYRSIAPSITQCGGYALAVYELGFSQLSPLILPNASRQDAVNILNTFLKALDSLHIPYNATISSFPGFLEGYTTLSNQTLFAIANAQVGGSLLLESYWKSNSSLEAINNVLKTLISSGAGVYNIVVSPKVPMGGPPRNSVFPAWRTTQATVSVFLPWDDHGNAAEAHAQQTITKTFMPAVKAVTPGSGAYMNEASAPFSTYTFRLNL